MALDPEAWDEVCRRRAAGESIRALAKASGMSASTLRKRLASASASAATPAKKKSEAAKKPTAKSKPKRTAASAKRPRTASSASTVRRKLIARLYRAIDTKLKLMEVRMNSEIDAIDSGGGPAATGNDTTATAGRTSADHERETRAFGALVKTINSVRQMQAELDTLANAHTVSTASTANPTAADARLAADAERYRRDIAERLAKFVPPQS